MALGTSRRRFLQQAAGGTAAAWALSGTTWASAQESKAPGAIPPLVTISGQPRERGRAYGRMFAAGIRDFLEKEIWQAFLEKPASKDEMLRYAAACGRVVKETCPIIHDELEGIAEGSGLRLEDLLLITLHEELYHRGVLPKVPHCTAVAAGPPDTVGGKTYVGQTWDWMQSVYGLSSMLRWQRTEGPSVLAYGFPGLWVGAGLNSAGVALTWTSASLGDKALGARVGLPSYVLLTHLLYQESLDAALEEARRNRHAGWFTFVLGDGAGQLANIEGSPQSVAIEQTKGHLVRVGYGTRKMTGTPEGKPVPLHARCQKMVDHLAGSAGKTDLKGMQHFFEDPTCGISVGKSTIDMLVFDTTERIAWLSRGPSYQTAWKEFRFGGRR